MPRRGNAGRVTSPSRWKHRRSLSGATPERVWLRLKRWLKQLVLFCKWELTGSRASVPVRVLPLVVRKCTQYRYSKQMS